MQSAYQKTFSSPDTNAKAENLIDPFSIRAKAKERLPRMMFDFIDGGTGGELAQAENSSALQRIKLQSRILRNVETIDASTRIMGNDYDFPIGIAPMGMCNLVASSADKSIAHLARDRNIPHCVSTAASTTMEQSIKESDGRSWFQLYAGSNREFTFELMDRAQAGGYQTLVFTVDTPRNSRRPRDLVNGFSVPLNWGPRQVFDFASHPRWSMAMLRSGSPKPMNYATSKMQTGFERYDSRGASDWDFLKVIRENWKGKLVVKGVMSVEDALDVERLGGDAIYVSNHGGRQLDSGMAAINVLAEIKSVLRPETAVIFDSGVRSADDIVRACALGADLVMLGRPILYALAAGGEHQLRVFFNHLENDLKSVMAQVGATSIADIDHRVLADLQSTDVDNREGMPA